MRKILIALLLIPSLAFSYEKVVNFDGDPFSWPAGTVMSGTCTFVPTTLPSGTGNALRCTTGTYSKGMYAGLSFSAPILPLTTDVYVRYYVRFLPGWVFGNGSTQFKAVIFNPAPHRNFLLYEMIPIGGTTGNINMEDIACTADYGSPWYGSRCVGSAASRMNADGTWYLVETREYRAGANSRFTVWLNEVVVMDIYAGSRAGQPSFDLGSTAMTWIELGYDNGSENTPGRTQNLGHSLEYEDVVIADHYIGPNGGTPPGPPGDTVPPFVDTFSPSDGATGVLVGTTSASFHVKDSGTSATGVNIATLNVGARTCTTCGSCSAGLTCSGTSADYTITRTGLSLSYSEAWSENITVSDVQGNAMASRTYNFTVQPDPQPALAVTTTTLPGATVASTYSQALAATGGVSPYTWSVSAGLLPTGLSLTTGGVINGLPTTSGTVSFTVLATDSDTPPNTDTQALSIVVVPASPVGGGTTQNTNFADTFINKSGSGTNTNYSTENYLEVYQSPASTVANRIILMDNVDIQSIPSGRTITAAKLRLYQTGYEGSGGTNPMRVYVYVITGTVPDTTTVTWTNRTGTLTQLTGGYTDVDLTTGFKEWDVLPAVQTAYAGRIPLYLALDGGGTGGQDANRIFASVDHATAAWRPQLVVTSQVPINLIPPLAPTSHSVQAGNAQVTLYRGTSSGATQYNCYYTSNGTTPTKSNGTKIAGIATPYVLTGLANGTTYKFIFTATNADGESVESTVDTATPVAPPPAAPTGHYVSAGDNQVTLYHGTSTGATAYNAYWTSNGSTPTTSSAKITGIADAYVLTGLTSGTTYKFVFTATSAAGESVVSTTDSATPVTPPPVVPPGAPTGHSVTAGVASVILYPGTAAGAVSYNGYYTDDGSVPTTGSTKLTSVTGGQILSGLANGTLYKFVFTAVDTNGESVVSATVSATPQALAGIVPDPPTLHSVGAGSGYVNLFPGTSPGALSYNAYYTSDNTAPTTGSTKITGAVGGQRLVATNGLTYKFVFTAVNATGESAASTVDTALPTASEAVNFLINTGNYITTIINGLKNYVK